MGDVLVVGYNLSFDIEFLVAGGAIAAWPMRTFDVMTEYASVHSKDGRWRKLTECAAHYGVSFGAHDASEDARATAACFLALLADTKWCVPEARRIEERLSTVFTSQTKAASENVRGLVSMGRIVCDDAELRLGAVTRGATKGTPRYEAYVDGLLVGTTATTVCNDVKRLLTAQELPESLPCTATLSSAGGETRCVVKVTSGASLAKTVTSLARKAKGRVALGASGTPAAASVEVAPVPNQAWQAQGYAQPTYDAGRSDTPARSGAMTGVASVIGALRTVWSRLPKWAKVIVVLLLISLVGNCVR